MNEIKQKLIAALDIEKNRLRAAGFSIEEHCVTIEYLKTGVNPYGRSQLEKYPLLDAAINDYDCLLSDYDIKGSKTTYSKEEVVELCKKAFDSGAEHFATEGKIYGQSDNIDVWLKKNVS